MPQHKTHRIPLDVRGLIGDGGIFRVAGAVKRDPAVDTWLSDEPVELRSMAAQWFKQFRQCGDDVGELMHDGCPVACVGDAPFGYVNSFKSHINVGFFYGAALKDPAHLLAGTGKRMRHVKLKPEQLVDSVALNNLVQAAYIDIKQRIDSESRQKS